SRWRRTSLQWAFESVHAAGRIGAIEREGGNGDIEQPAVLVDHLIAADHDARWRRKGTARRVGEGLARPDHRLLAYHARAAHFVGLAVGVGNAPDAALELNGVLALVSDLDRVDPEEVALLGRGLLFRILGGDADANAVRHLLVWDVIRHKAVR